MPWPFDDNDDPFRRRDIFSSFDKDFEEMFKMIDGLNRDSIMHPGNQSTYNKSRPPVNIRNPRSYFLHDPRHFNERRTSKPLAPGIQDTEVSIGNNYGALLDNPSVPPRPNSSMGSNESISTTWMLKNGRMCKQERREQIIGRQRRVSITSTDEKGNITTNEYTEDI